VIVCHDDHSARNVTLRKLSRCELSAAPRRFLCGLFETCKLNTIVIQKRYLTLSEMEVVARHFLEAFPRPEMLRSPTVSPGTW
jgi:hypothetical protein